MTDEAPKRVCDFRDYERLGAGSALSLLADKASAGMFASEADYRRWFVREALEPLLAHLRGGMAVRDVRIERSLGGTGLRLDVEAVLTDGSSVGFELKATNRKNPQTARYALVQGVGQALLYQDLLSAFRGRRTPVFLVSDVVYEPVAELLLRHGLMVGLVEANPTRIVCFAGSGPTVN